MTIANYISDLLYRYECVILPGFGAILTNRQPAQINKGTHTFTPPGKTLSFNRQLVQNDGLLTNYISKTENISFEEAFEKLQQYLHFIETEIEEGKKVEIENVGQFFLSSEEKILFEPNQKVNYLTEAFGLATYTSEAISRTYTAEPDAAATVNATREDVRQIGPFLKYAAIGILAIGIAGFAGFQVYNNQVTEHNIAEQQKAESQIEQEIQHATFVIDNPLPVVTLNFVKQKGNYHIVAGAFRVKENASKKVEELRAAGYKAKEIGANKYGLHQVIYSSYETRREALTNLRTIQANINSGAWLLVQEL